MRRSRKEQAQKEHDREFQEALARDRAFYAEVRRRGFMFDGNGIPFKIPDELKDLYDERFPIAE